MTNEQKSAPTAQDIQQALDQIAEQQPSLNDIVSAFRPLMLAQARIRCGLPLLDSPLPRLDAARLAQGAPLAGVEDFLSCAGLDLREYLDRAAREVLPALEEGLPALTAELGRLGQALADQALDAPACLEALLGGRQEELQAMGEGLGLPPTVLTFVFIQLAKPLLQQRTQALAPLLRDQPWQQGSCPVCGSMPELAILTGEGGQRWLRCSLCAHHWRAKRTACPVCGNEDQDKLQFLYAEGRERERVDCCKQCGNYVVCLDVRGMDRQPVWEVAALGLVHLDLVAQGSGLSPAARCAWNLVR